MKTKMRQLIVCLFLINACQGIAQEKGLDTLSYYPYIQAIYNGPILWHKDSSNPYDLGVMHRAVLIEQERYYGIIIESYKVADEGGRELAKSELVPFEMNSDKMPTISWVSPNIIKIEHGGEPYELVISEGGIIKRRP